MTAEITIVAPRIHTGEGVVEDAALRIADGRIVALGGVAEVGRRGEVVEHAGLVTPGLVDAHTHAVWAGSRAEEYAMRMAGADYEAIAAAGGGIVASMRAVRAASRQELVASLRARVRRMAALGVTTVEVKSGYGLDEASERKQLEAVAEVARDSDGPRLVATYLGMHATPPGKDKDSHARDCVSWLDGIAEDGLAQFVDAYVDRSAFSVAHARPLCERARALGLGVRLHVGQFADVGGAELAAEMGAASVDHVEQLSPGGAEALAAAGTVAVMLPVASYTLGQAPPDVAQLRAQGVSLAVASDANPGTAPTESLPLAMAMAVRSYGMTVDEVMAGVTSVAARSLGLEVGVLRVGAPADVVLWDVAREHELVQPWGVSKARAVFRDGRVIAGA